MAEYKQYKDTPTRNKGKGVGHWARIAVSILSGGFVFPHAFTEGDDEANLSRPTDHAGRVKSG